MFYTQLKNIWSYIKSSYFNTSPHIIKSGIAMPINSSSLENCYKLLHNQESDTPENKMFR